MEVCQVPQRLLLPQDGLYSKYVLPVSKGKAVPVHRPLGLHEVEAPSISRESAHEGGKVVSSTRRPPLPPLKYPHYSVLLEAESTPES